jgi:pimeloyl-ACP methyl ester carboxylesterase
MYWKARSSFLVISFLAALFAVAGVQPYPVIPGSGHWLMEEQPQATVAVIVAFLQ